jgi:hypothetical protein
MAALQVLIDEGNVTCQRTQELFTSNTMLPIVPYLNMPVRLKVWASRIWNIVSSRVKSDAWVDLLCWAHTAFKLMPLQKQSGKSGRKQLIAIPNHERWADLQATWVAQSGDKNQISLQVEKKKFDDAFKIMNSLDHDWTLLHDTVQPCYHLEIRKLLSGRCRVTLKQIQHGLAQMSSAGP